MLPLDKVLTKIDYFTDAEKDSAESFLTNSKALVTRSQLLKEMATKTRMMSQRDLGLLTTYYSKKFKTCEALTHLHTKLSYYTAVSPHTLKELRQADSLILNFRDAKLELNLPAICLVVIPNYCPKDNNRVITELEILNHSAITSMQYLGGN